MVHAVSASYLQSERMSPPAAGLALALHVTVALALWWVSPLKFVEPESEPIEVTMEAPPPKPPQAQPSPPPAPPQTPPAASAAAPPAQPPAPPRPTPKTPLGLPPPAPATADKPTQEPPKKEQPQEATAPAKPEPEPPPVEKALPPVEAPAPPLTMQDFVKIAPPPPPHEVVKPLPQQVTPHPPPQQQALRPSPLSGRPQQQSPDSRSPTAPQNTFVNPADLARRNTLVEDYLLQITRKFTQYVYYTRDAHEQGTVVVRFTIARDGRLMDSSILRSSGFVSIDKEVLDALRRAAPYPPLPAGLPGESVTFNLPISSRYQR